jgi:pentose-5-phosphate-3-epimerase
MPVPVHYCDHLWMRRIQEGSKSYGSYKLAMQAEYQGALGVVLNKPTPNELIKRVKQKIDIPVVITIVSEKDDIKGRIAAGVNIFNVSGAEKTKEIVHRIREYDDKVAILATGGKNDDSILMVIEKGANAISYTSDNRRTH